jgi:hypothetical protein
MLVHLCQRYECKADDDRESHGARGTKKYDVHFLSLDTFRLIVIYLVFDDPEELNVISATSNHAFFYSFVPWLARLANLSIVLPRTDEELKDISPLYIVVGLPGCAGSANCIHMF